MLPPFETRHRLRPVSLVAEAGGARLDLAGDGLDDPRLVGAGAPLAAPAPCVAAEATLRDAADGPVEVALLLGGWRLAGWYDPRRGRTGLTLTPPDGPPAALRSRRHGRARERPTKLGLALTGPWLSLLTHERGAWVVRARTDLRDHAGTPDVHDQAVLAGLAVGLAVGLGPVPGGVGRRLTRLRAGGFGQLGLRDVRLVTDADGEPLRDGRRLWLTATHAGPAFADAAHTGVWLLDPDAGALEHTGDLFVRRPSPRRPGGAPGVHGDHAVHLLRDGDAWLLAATTWNELGPDPRRRPPPPGAVTTVLARSDDDPRRGCRVLEATPLRLPVSPGVVGSWDPHLRREPDGGWLVAFVEADRWFRFHPALASGPDLASLEPRAADPDRSATEGVTLARLGDAEDPAAPVRVLVSDGPDSPAERRRRYVALDLDLREVGRLEAEYPSNLPWPTLARDGDGWWLVTFDGTPAGGRLPGYGTHGDLVVARSERSGPVRSGAGATVADGPQPAPRV